MPNASLLLSAMLLQAAVADYALTTHGWGPVRAGMSLEEAEAALGRRLMPAHPAESSEPCYYVAIQGVRDASLMVQDGLVTRIDIDAPTWATLSGVRVGDSEEKAIRTYGERLSIEPHAYVEQGHYLIIRTRDEEHALLIETVDQKVVRMRGGQEGPVQYIEGCQ